MISGDSEIELGETTPLFRSQSNLNAAKNISKESSFRQYAQVAMLVGAVLVLGAWLFQPQGLSAVDYGSSALASTSPPPPTLFAPFSTKDPRSLNFSGVTRPDSTPGPAFGKLREQHLPLPTNSWSQNLLYGNELTGPNNRVDQIPYIVDTAGLSPGVRTHGTTVQANSVMVMTIFDPDDGLALGAVETVSKNQKVVPYPAFGRLALTLEWEETANATSSKGKSSAPQPADGGRMRSPIVRGCPYTTMEYTDLSPRITVQRALAAAPVIDGQTGDGAPSLICGVGKGNFSEKPVMVERELRLQFDTSDMTWLVFVSRPTEFTCSNNPMPPPDPNATPLAPGVVPTYPNGAPSALFDLRATSRMSPAGVVRIALVNNCTTGQSPQHCTGGQPRDQSAYESVIRKHAEVYPSGAANIEFGFPEKAKEVQQTILHFDWAPTTMSSGNVPRPTVDVNTPSGKVGKNHSNGGTTDVPSRRLSHSDQVLMLALPHQQTSLRTVNSSMNVFLEVGCVSTLHGTACPVLGNIWNQFEEMRDVQFSALSSYKSEMLDDLRSALQKDLDYQIPVNYMKGAGDTYFSGKMLAKLARIIQIGSEVAGLSDEKKHATWLKEYKTKHTTALDRLRRGVEIWLNGSALAPLVFDDSWGGVVGCGCNFNGATNGCDNTFPDCPALTDPGQNYGSGFYNDHHFHYGYHIYAAAILTHFDHKWGREFHEHVLCLIRDIANPSESDPFFPMWRHKDWYLGSSWASGIVNFQGNPYPNGRNQESSSEAINAYEGIALYGLAAKEAFSDDGHESAETTEQCTNIFNMGKLLLSTEIRSAQVYYHVQSADSDSSVQRIYPVAYTPKIVGMLWSFLAQEQTWFGNQAWASYGIQLMPVTPTSQYRDTIPWVKEMLPSFSESCFSDPVCEHQGWSILVFTCQATIGKWQEAWRGIQKLPESVFSTAGGNGHSRTNSLWWIATRP